jgi:uncharacterized Zn-finger protein
VCHQCGKNSSRVILKMIFIFSHSFINSRLSFKGKAFGSSHNLEVHNIVHTGYKPYICKMCGKAFARKAEIRDHERIHTGEKPYQCEFCGATFR